MKIEINFVYQGDIHMSDAIPIHINPREKEFLGHPVGLSFLFFTEMWERFSFYGMKFLLKLYMVNYILVSSRQILQGSSQRVVGDPSTIFGWNFIHTSMLGGESNIGAIASVILGWYMMTVYLTPVIGGYLADRYGRRLLVYIGGLIMAVGHFFMIYESMFFIALLLIALGNGAFKPNISTQVGTLYKEGDPRRDGAFTLFYMGVNLGAFLAGLIPTILAATLGWHYAFASAGIGMMLGLCIYTIGRKYLPEDTHVKKAVDSIEIVKEKLTKEDWGRIGALVVLCILNVVFWMTFEQQGNTLTTWSDTKTVWPTILGFKIPSTWFNMFNPIMVFIGAPILELFWRYRAGKGKVASSVSKMSFGCIVAAGAFAIMSIGANVVGAGQGSFMWLFSCTLLLTLGELYLSPIGLSLVTKVAPVKILSLMMGVWYLSSAGGNLLMGKIGVLYEKAVLTPCQFFLFCATLLLLVGIVMALIQKPLKKFLGDC